MLYELTDEQVAWIRNASNATHTPNGPRWTLGQSHEVHMAIKSSLDNPVNSEPTEEELAIARRHRVAQNIDLFPGWTYEEIHRWVQTGSRR